MLYFALCLLLLSILVGLLLFVFSNMTISEKKYKGHKAGEQEHPGELSNYRINDYINDFEEEL